MRIINVAAALHNIRIHFNVPEHEEQSIQEENDVIDYGEVVNSQEDQTYSSDANEFRNQILLSF